MWQLPKGKNFLPNVSLKRLQQLYDKEKSAKGKIRLLCAIHRKKGESIDKIAYVLAKHRRTVHSWLTRFKVSGIDGKDSKKAPGKIPALTNKQRAELITLLERGPPYNSSGLWSTKEVRELIATRYNRTYVKQHVWRLMVSLGFTMQRPRKRHYLRPSDDELLQFKKKRSERQDTIGQKDLLWARRMRQPLA